MPHALAPPPGIYPPLVNFFNEDYSLDIPTIIQHALRSAKSGVAGLVILGSNGEAVHMDASERILLVSSIRKALDKEGLKMPLIVGCGQQSKRATLQTIKEAKEAGGDFALVLPPSYWPTAMTKGNVTGYFKELADESELPILVYNFPLVANGVMVDSDQLLELAGHDNVVGCKLTCGVSRLFVFPFCHFSSCQLFYPMRIRSTTIRHPCRLLLMVLTEPWKSSSNSNPYRPKTLRGHGWKG
jgi:4-hydroxy-2-oxoglutarate aldolase